MNNADLIKNTVLKLINANSAEEITQLINREPLLINSQWWPYGNTESNFSIASAQAKDSVNALVEKIINSIDALLLSKCIEAGIDPKSNSAPQSMYSAIDKFFNIPKGNLAQIDDFTRRSLAQNIRVIADGNKDKPNIIIADFGEGQNSTNFPTTFLSLPTGSSNKADIPFVQGKYNMGSAGSVIFCGDSDNRYQLILSKRNPVLKDSNNLWAFTLVRQVIKPNSKIPMFEYLVDNEGSIYSFETENLPILPDKENMKHGSFIKLYSYYLKDPSIITLGLWRLLNRKLFAPALPILMHETRGYKGHSPSKVMQGNKYRIGDDEHKWVEKTLPINSDLSKIGNRNIDVTIFRDRVEEKDKNGAIAYKSFPGNEFTSPTEAIFFTVNGQVHHTIGKSTLETRANLRNIAKYLMIHIDVSDVGPLLTEIFHGARESARENGAYQEIEDRLISDLRDNPFLKSWDEEYRRREIQRIQPDTGFVKKMAVKILTENPEWISKLNLPSGLGVPLSTGVGQSQKFIPSDIPTRFELKGDKNKVVPINNKYSWVNFTTDAPDDYFTRHNNQGDFIIESSIPFDKSYWISEGLISLKIITPDTSTVGSIIHIKARLTRPEDSDLVQELTIQFSKEKEKTTGPTTPRTPKGINYNLPEPDAVDKSRWDEFVPSWTSKDIAAVTGAKISINIDSYDLHSFIDRHQKKYKKESIIETYKTLIYLYAFILDNELSDKESGELNIQENKEKIVSKLMQGISKVVLPVNFEGFLKELE